MNPKLLNILLIGGVVLGVSVATRYYADAPPPGPQAARQEQAASDRLPAFKFRDLEGKEHDSADFEGKAVILNFWATWCAPCVAEFPKLLEAAEARKGGAVLIALSSDRNAEDIARFAGRLDAESRRRMEMDNVIVALDTEGLTQRAFRVMRLPETLLVGPDHTVQDRLVGAEWTVQDLDARMNALK